MGALCEAIRAEMFDFVAKKMGESEMPTCARKEIVEADVVSSYHCHSRCVRRAFLCGVDPVTGRDYQHRRDWFDVRVKQMESVFMVELLSFAYLHNHFHVMLRIRPDLAAKLSDWEVARRMLKIQPDKFPDTEELPEPSARKIQAAIQDQDKIQKWRERLSDLSWYMRYLKEPIARRANEEDGVTGHFWEGRFRSTRLLDGFSAEACSCYIDVNEIRAGLVDLPKEAVHSAIGQRILALNEERQRISNIVNPHAKRRAKQSKKEPAPFWLAPICVRSDNGTVSGTMTEEQPKPDARRPSDSGFLELTLEQHIKLCDWTSLCCRLGKAAPTPKDLQPILDRITRNIDAFLKVVQNFGSIFKRFCGTPESLQEHQRKCGLKKVHGISAVRSVFATSS